MGSPDSTAKICLDDEDQEAKLKRYEQEIAQLKSQNRDLTRSNKKLKKQNNRLHAAQASSSLVATPPPQKRLSLTPKKVRFADTVPPMVSVRSFVPCDKSSVQLMRDNDAQMSAGDKNGKMYLLWNLLKVGGIPKRALLLRQLHQSVLTRGEVRLHTSIPTSPAEPDITSDLK